MMPPKLRGLSLLTSVGLSPTGCSVLLWTRQLPSGENINFMPDGGIAVNRRGAISDLGVDINLAGSIHNSAVEQADRSYNAAKSEAVAAGENYTAGMRSLYELAEHSGSSKSSGDSWVTSESSNIMQSVNKVKELTRSFADEHQISYEHAKEILTNAHAGVNASGNIGIGFSNLSGAGVNAGGSISGSVGIEGSVGHKDTDNERRLYQAAETFINKSGYSESVDISTKAAIDHSLHSSNEQGARLLDSMASSFDKAHSLRKDADTHFQEAVSYRNVASQAKEDAVNINVNASQDFLKYISNSPDHSGRGRMGIMTALGHLQNPETAKVFADNFAQNYAKAHLSNWSAGMQYSQQGIKREYQSNAESIADQANANIQKQQSTNEEQIKNLADTKELTREDLVDTSAKANAETQLQTNKQNIQQEKDDLDSSGLAREQKINAVMVKKKQDRNHKLSYDTARRDEIKKEIRDKIDKKE